MVVEDVLEELVEVRGCSDVLVLVEEILEELVDDLGCSDVLVVDEEILEVLVRTVDLLVPEVNSVEGGVSVLLYVVLHLSLLEHLLLEDSDSSSPSLMNVMM